MDIERQTLRDVLSAQAHRYDRHTFLEAAGRSYSYADVDERTDLAATVLVRMGLKPRDRVALLLSNRPEFVFCFLGAVKLGVTAVPVDPSRSHGEIAHVLRHSQPAVVITESRFDSFRESLPECRSWVVVDSPEFAAAPFQGLESGSVLGFWPDLEAGDPAVVTYSHRGLHAPRGIVLTHGNLLSNARQMLRPFRIDASDRFLCALPLSSVTAQVLLLITPWLAGATCVLREAFAPRLLEAISRNRATVLAGTPHTFQIMSGQEDFSTTDLSSLRLAISPAGPVGKDILGRFESAHDTLIVEAYGVPEATCITLANPYTGVRKPDSLGMPLPGQSCRITGDHGEELEPGASGRIAVRGPNVMLEYLRDPSATAEVLQGGWLLTGDHGYIDSDGYYFLRAPGA